MDVSALIPGEVKRELPRLGPGDTVKVSIKLKEGDTERTQIFQGMVIKIKKGGNGASFTVRRSIYGIGVERTFYNHSPSLLKVEVLRQARVRRAKLYFVRSLSSRQLQAKIKAKGRETVKLEDVLKTEEPVKPAEATKPEE